MRQLIRVGLPMVESVTLAHPCLLALNKANRIILMLRLLRLILLSKGRSCGVHDFVAALSLLVSVIILLGGLLLLLLEG
jgi:hypothetical protein